MGYGLMVNAGILKETALLEGFSFVGISKAEPVEGWMRERYLEWIGQGGHADMDYLERNIEKRFDPRLLVRGVKSIVSVAMNYCPQRRLPEGEPQIADYALGKDYHDVVKARLKLMAEKLGLREFRCFSDSAPVLERYWAQKSGLGWIGRNDQLTIPGAGSMFFLGELFMQEECDHYDQPCENHCGNCRKCLEACPTGAIRDGELFCSERCLSYQTIENRGSLSELAQEKMGDMFYGCDRCQRACPWNRFSKPTDIPELMASEELLHMTKEKWSQLSEDDYRRLFKGSAVKRAKYEGLIRNLNALYRKH